MAIRVESVPFGVFQLVVRIRPTSKVQSLDRSIKVGRDETNWNLTGENRVGNGRTSLKVRSHVSQELFLTRCVPCRFSARVPSVQGRLVPCRKRKSVDVFRKRVHYKLPSCLQRCRVAFRCRYPTDSTVFTICQQTYYGIDTSRFQSAHEAVVADTGVDAIYSNGVDPQAFKVLDVYLPKVSELFGKEIDRVGHREFTVVGARIIRDPLDGDVLAGNGIKEAVAFDNGRMQATVGIRTFVIGKRLTFRTVYQQECQAGGGNPQGRNQSRSNHGLK